MNKCIKNYSISEATHSLAKEFLKFCVLFNQTLKFRFDLQARSLDSRKMGVRGLETLLSERHAYEEVDLSAIANTSKVVLTVDGLSLCHYLRNLVWVCKTATKASEKAVSCATASRKSRRLLVFQSV